MMQIDPCGEDFDAYACLEARCYEVGEQCFGDPNDEDFEEVLFCDATPDYICPLYAISVKEDFDM